MCYCDNLQFNHNLQLPSVHSYFDMMLASFLNHSQTNHWELLLDKHNITVSYSLEELFGKVNKPIFVEEDRLAKYACEQANALFTLYPVVLKQLKELNLESLYYDVELPLSSVLYEMEVQGIRIDQDVLDEIATFFKDEITLLSLGLPQ